MSDVIPLKYVAFLSYSHRDQEIGETLHREIETYRIPPDLIGTPGLHGAVPSKLRPVFRDRFDLESGPSLRDQVAGALADSQALIVLCSPSSAKSPYVNEEIRQFKAMGRADRIYPIIIDGEPGHPEFDCFAPALRHVVDDEGRITKFLEEPIAADMREVGDGPELARLKVVSGLLGVDLDRLRRREAEDQKRQKRFWAGVSAFMAVLAIAAIAGGTVAWIQRQEKNIALQKNEQLLDATLDQTSSLVSNSVINIQRNGLPVKFGVGLLEQAQGFFKVMDDIKATSPKIPLRRAEMEIAFSSSYQELGKGDLALRHARKARDSLLEKIKQLDEDGEAPEPGTYLQLARAYLHVARGQSDRSWLPFARISANSGLEEIAKAIELQPKNPRFLKLRADLYMELADTYRLDQNWDQAVEYVGKSQEVARELGKIGATKEASSTHAVAMISLADFARSRGQIEQAMKANREGEDMVRVAMRLHPGDLIWQTRLYRLLIVRADVHRLAKRYEDALTGYREALTTVEETYRRDPYNARVTSQFAFAKLKISEVATSLNKLDIAEEAVIAASDAYERLIEGDPDSRSYNLTYLHALEALGELQRRLRKTEEMAQTHERRLGVVEGMLVKEPSNPSLMRHAATASFMAAEAYKMRGRAVRARTRYDTAIAYRKRQIDSGQDTDQNRFEHAFAILQKGRTFEDQEDHAQALVIYRQAVELMDKVIASFEPGSYVRWRYIGAVESIASVLTKTGDPQGGLQWFGKVVDLRKIYAEANPSYSNRRALAHTQEMIASSWRQAGDLGKAIALLEAGIEMRQAFVEEEPGDPQRRRNLANSWKLLAEARLQAGICDGVRDLVERAAAEMTNAIAQYEEQHGEGKPGWPDQLKTIQALQTQAAAKCPSVSEAPDAPAGSASPGNQPS